MSWIENCPTTITLFDAGAMPLYIGLGITALMALATVRDPRFKRDSIGMLVCCFVGAGGLTYFRCRVGFAL
jgi:hypothetical protein